MPRLHKQTKMTEFEKQVTEENQYEPVSFTNIDSEDFGAETWSEHIEENNGGRQTERDVLYSKDNAMWAGKPYSVKAGETKSYPRFLATHLAKHLINKILGKQDPKTIRNIPERNALFTKIVSEPGQFQEQSPRLSEGDRVANMVEKMQGEVKKIEEKVEPFAELHNEVNIDMTRTELMKIAKDKGIKVETTDTKSNLIEKIKGA